MLRLREIFIERGDGVWNTKLTIELREASIKTLSDEIWKFSDKENLTLEDRVYLLELHMALRDRQAERGRWR